MRAPGATPPHRQLAPGSGGVPMSAAHVPVAVSRRLSPATATPPLSPGRDSGLPLTRCPPGRGTEPCPLHSDPRTFAAAIPPGAALLVHPPEWARPQSLAAPNWLDEEADS